MRQLLAARRALFDPDVGGVFSDPTYYVKKDDKPDAGSFSSRRDAVERAEKESGDRRP